MRLTDWFLTKDFFGNIQAHGYVFGHHRLSDGDWIHTSKVISMAVGEESYTIKMHTYSGSLYELSVDDIDIYSAEATGKLAVELGISEEVCQKLTLYGRERKNVFCKNISEQIMAGELYLVFRGVNVKGAFWKNKAEECREINISCHIGMFQDSILILDREKGEVDFRYFPGLGEITPYAWSEGLKAVWIDNQSNVNITFRVEEDAITCHKRAVTRIDSKM